MAAASSNTNASIVCPGLKLDWHSVDGLVETLGKHGVTSNYRYDLAPYTWELVQGSSPATPSSPNRRCRSSAPARRRRRCTCPPTTGSGKAASSNIDVGFYNAGGVLFGVKEYVPALMEYVERYRCQAQLLPQPERHRRSGEEGMVQGRRARPAEATVEVAFDMIHVRPPQTAPDFIRVSPLADAAGWVDVDQATLRHKKFDNI